MSDIFLNVTGQHQSRRSLWNKQGVCGERTGKSSSRLLAVHGEVRADVAVASLERLGRQK